MVAVAGCKPSPDQGPLAVKDPDLRPNDSLEQMIANLRKQDYSQKFVAPELEQALKNPTVVTRLEVQAAIGRLDEIGTLVNLRELLLTYLQAKQLPASMANLIQLQQLDMLCLPALTEMPAVLASLPQLQRLSVVGGTGCDTMRLPYNTFGVVGSLSNLRELRVRQIKTVYTFPGELGRLRRLHYLDFSGTNATAVSPAIGNLTNLDTLVLDDNRLTSLPNEMGKLANLKFLSVRGNRNLRSLPASLASLSNLECLALGFGDDELFNTAPSAAVSYNLPTGIENLKNVGWFQLYGFDDETVARLQALFPNARITNDVYDPAAEEATAVPEGEASATDPL
jgi:Leucine-rich repeat (LRR) protein